MSVDVGLDILEELELDMSSGHQCETIWFNVDNGVVDHDSEKPCQNPAIVQVRINFFCGNYDIRWKCQYCLDTMRSQGKWGCIPCDRVEPFTLEIL